MGRATIDFGIDFGTTNSAIACMQHGRVEVVKNSLTQSELTPSAVMVDAKGSVLVGESAFRKQEFDAENVAVGFKRWLGGSDAFRFQKSGRVLKSEELCAEVLKSLKADVQARFEEDLKAAVITVPADWPIPKCEATLRGAQLAGLDLTPLLQEPIAAAMAYGFHEHDLRGILMVFDLGGGTFDTSLLSAKDGRLVVLGNDGCLLGGRDFDDRLRELIIERLVKEFRGLDLSPENPAAKRARAKLRYQAEEAKKQLSVRNSVSVAIGELGAGFEEIETAIEITRNEYERLIVPDVAKAISICKRLLDSKGLAPSAIEAILLVGGPMHTPYIRAALKNSIETFQKAEIDPMTVVAQGAALFASSQRLPQKKPAQPTQGQVHLSLHYSPVAEDTEAFVGITVEPVPVGGQVKIVRADGGWSSGATRVPASGKVTVTVPLRSRKPNEFDIQVLDAKGSALAAEPASFTITQGLPVAQALTAKSFGVALDENAFDILIKKGTPLPAKGKGTYQTVHPVTAGSKESALNIYILEGEHPRADRNLEIKVLQLLGSDCGRSLPAGETVEVTFRIDESRRLSATATIPFLNQTIEIVRPLESQIALRDPEQILAELQREEERRQELASLAPGDPGIQEFEKQVVDIKHEVAAARTGDPEARQKAFGDLLELKATLDKVEEKTQWERLAKEFEERKEAARELISSHGTEEQKKRLELLIREAEEALTRKAERILQERLEAINNLFFGLLFSLNDYWVSQFRSLDEAGVEYVDQARASRLREEGRRAVGRQDYESLKTIVLELWSLLPSWQRSKFDQRFQDASLRRAYGRQR